MKNMFLVIFIIALSGQLILAEITKDYKAEFKVEKGKKIWIKTASGMNAKVISWDSSLVKFDLRVEISSSDKDYEREYIDAFKIIEERGSSGLSLKFEEASGGGWSFLDIFRLKFNFYVNKNITGTIYIPKQNSLNADFKYSEIKLEDLQGQLDLPGRSNELTLRNCKSLGTISNDYGNSEITNCGGELNFESRSAELRIKNFNGKANISADYMNIWLEEIGGNTIVGSRSGNMEISNVHGNLDVNAPYTDMKIYNVDGFTTIVNRSESILINNSKGLFIDGQYCEMDISDIKDVKNRTIKIGGRSGSINMVNIEGDIKIDDKYSSISLNNVIGDVDLISRSETITAKSVRGDINFETEYCDITIEELNASRVKMTNRSGGIKLDFMNTPADLSIHNEYGKVRLDLLPGYEGEYELTASHGKIDSSLPLHIREKSSSESASGKIGNKSNKMVIETRSDDIIIREK